MGGAVARDAAARVDGGPVPSPSNSMDVPHAGMPQLLKKNMASYDTPSIRCLGARSASFRALSHLDNDFQSGTSLRSCANSATISALGAVCTGADLGGPGCHSMQPLSNATEITLRLCDRLSRANMESDMEPRKAHDCAMNGCRSGRRDGTLVCALWG